MFEISPAELRILTFAVVITVIVCIAAHAATKRTRREHAATVARFGHSKSRLLADSSYATANAALESAEEDVFGSPFYSGHVFTSDSPIHDTSDLTSDD